MRWFTTFRISDDSNLNVHKRGKEVAYQAQERWLGLFGTRSVARLSDGPVHNPSEVQLLLLTRRARSRRVHAGADRCDAGGRKELIGFQVGVRESAQSWRELLVEVKSRGLTIAPGNCRRRRCARLLEGARRGLSRHAASAVLGAQDHTS